MSIIRQFCFPALASTFLLGACATFQDKELPRTTSWVKAPAPEERLNIAVVVRCSAGDPTVVMSEGRCSRIGRYEKPQDLMPVLEKQFAESGLFASWRLSDLPMQVPADLTLELRLTNQYDNPDFHPGVMTANTAHKLSFGLIPAFDSDRYTLDMRLRAPDGHLYGAVANSDSTTTWSGIWLLPVTSYPPSASAIRAFEATFVNQLQVALNDMASRGLLVRPRPGRTR